VDEAIAGHAKRIDVVLYKDWLNGSNGRRPRLPGGQARRAREYSGVEVILTRLHAGGKVLEQEPSWLGWQLQLRRYQSLQNAPCKRYRWIPSPL